MPKINEMLSKLEGFQYPTLLDLKMGYYHIRLNDNTINLCTIIIPWIKYRCKRLPMGHSNSPYVFQNKMNDLFHGFEFIRAYIDNLLVLTTGDWTDHLQKLELTLNKSKGKLVKYNIEESFFGKTKMEYLYF